MEEGLGYERYAVQGGDWGANIAARMAFDSPATVAAVHVNAVSVLPVPGDLAEPPLSDAEQAYVEAGSRWRRREGFHLFLHSAAPDAVGVAFNDSPAGLAAWLVEKYRRWSDCGGEVERRFSKDQLCDFLTMYWATGRSPPRCGSTSASAATAGGSAPGERIEVPAAAADFPAEIVSGRPESGRSGSSPTCAAGPRCRAAATSPPSRSRELLADDVIEFLARPLTPGRARSGSEGRPPPERRPGPMIALTGEARILSLRSRSSNGQRRRPWRRV